MKITSVRDLNKVKTEGEKLLSPKNIRIQVGTTPYALSKKAKDVIKAFKKELKKQDVDAEVVTVGCTGICYEEPLVEVIIPGKPKVTYGKVNVDIVSAIVKAVSQGKVLKKHALYRTDSEEIVATGKTVVYSARVPAEYKGVPAREQYKFFQYQVRTVLRNAGIINPESIEEFIARGGYSALLKALTKMDPDKVIDVVTKADVRGRGGGGFPAGRKWKACRDAKGKQKYVLCNCSEGDPGIGMHKTIIESDPHSILEGLIIGGYAVGAKQGYIYLHYGYSAGKEMLKKAIAQAREFGLLGKDIFGSGFSFDIGLKEGAGAYVCGESTALMATLEGRAGEPRPKYIHTAEKGLWDCPTTLNNVETWCNIAPIIGRGAAWYGKTGTKSSKGTKVVSLTGDVNKPCLAEVPLGMKLKDIINKIGGGVLKGTKLKAIAVGGPPAGFLSADLANTPLDFDELTKVGSLLGSGGMVVMNDKTCMVDMAAFFMKFLQEESCGRCFPCREGLKRMYEILYGISVGIGKEEDLALLQELCDCLSQASLCDLGKSAPNVVRSALRFFEDEYKTHIQQQVCPSKRCSL